MASPQPQTLKLLTRDIAAYDDAELDKYIGANGGIVDVEDYDNLRKNTELIERLRRRATTHRAIDLNDLDARLANLPPSPASTEDLGDEEYYRLDLAEETEYYITLVREGGLPSHPIELGRLIVKQPGEYREILTYWQSDENDWRVFSRQLDNWKDFQRWQRKNRENGRFNKYADDVRQGLADHGFTRPFQLDEDPDRQDRLTRSIEFLDYEYWRYEKDMRTVKRQKPVYDAAWEALVGSQVLRPFETEQVVCDINSAIHRASERERAQEAVQSSKSALLSAQNKIANDKSSTSLQPLEQLLKEAQTKVDLALDSLELIKRRNALISEFLDKTKTAQIAKYEAERRVVLLKWIREQISRMESGAACTESSTTGPSTTVPSTIGLRRSKRKRSDPSDEKTFSKMTFSDNPERNSASNLRIHSFDRHKEAHIALSSVDLDRESQQSCKRSKRSTATMLSIHRKQSTEPWSQPVKVHSDNKLRRSQRVKRAPDRFQ